MNEFIGFSNLEAFNESADQYQGNLFKSATMSNNEQQQQHVGGGGDVGASNDQQASFNPILSHQGQLSLGDSVVPDLMKVYESLTQSSTPQMDLAAPAAYQQPTQQTYHQYPAAVSQYHQPQSQQIHSQPQYPLPAEKQLPDISHNSSGRSLRKRSPSQSSSTASDTGSSQPNKSRKKGNSDGRWSKRFTWPDELHRDFVSAVFDVGLKHSSPSAILSQMPEHENITSERIKSHLQKYRVHRAKSKSEFMGAYAASLNQFRTRGTGGVKSLASGEVAAHATYAVMKEEEGEMGVPSLTSSGHSFVPTNGDTSNQGGTLVLPKLTEEEKLSPIGASMGYLMGLYFSLNQQLMTQRAASLASGVPSMAQNRVPNAEAMQFGSSIPLLPFQEHAAAAVAPQPVGAHATTSMSAVRTNLEESHLMKRDMQSSREIQNKMRALKQHELNKVQRSTSGGGLEGAPQTHDDDLHEDVKPHGIEEGDVSFQGAGEAVESGNAQGAKDDGRSRGLSLGHPDDFWTNDEQLFEFLMDP